MLDNLSGQNCVPCRTGESDLEPQDIQKLLDKIPNWELVEDEGTQKLKRIFKLENWDQAIDLTNKISEIAVSQDHHPVLLLEWGKLNVWWWTHKVGGLHSNDFVMAAKTDKLV